MGRAGRHRHENEEPVRAESERLLRSLGITLKSLRLARGWSQELVASKAGLDRTYIGCIERGERNLGILNLLMLANALELSCSELLREAERSAPAQEPPLTQDPCLEAAESPPAQVSDGASTTGLPKGRKRRAPKSARARAMPPVVPEPVHP